MENLKFYCSLSSVAGGCQGYVAMLINLQKYLTQQQPIWKICYRNHEK